MSARYNLAPQAAIDLFEIWQSIKEQTSVTTADRVESVIRDRIVFLARNPEAGHRRKDLMDTDVKFFPVYSYLIVYRPMTKPLQIASILHGRRDLLQLLKDRLWEAARVDRCGRGSYHGCGCAVSKFGLAQEKRFDECT
jgi:plasmid stabilization system protein ParE